MFIVIDERIHTTLGKVWEKIHLEKLMALEASLMENIWQDNNFWPF